MSRQGEAGWLIGKFEDIISTLLVPILILYYNLLESLRIAPHVAGSSGKLGKF